MLHQGINVAEWCEDAINRLHSRRLGVRQHDFIAPEFQRSPEFAAFPVSGPRRSVMTFSRTGQIATHSQKLPTSGHPQDHEKLHNGHP